MCPLFKEKSGKNGIAFQLYLYKSWRTSKFLKIGYSHAFFLFPKIFSSLFLSGPPRVKQLRIESIFLTSSQNLSPETYAML